MTINACTHCGATTTGGRFCPSCGASQETGPASAADPLVGRVIGDRYEILEFLRAGGMGRIYRAVHRKLGRPVAIKFIHTHLLQAEHVASRFLIEAQAASRLNHPNIVCIFDFGQTPPEEGSDLYLVMELLGGHELDHEMQEDEPIALTRVANIFEQTLAALGEAHECGVVHRDVKPNNVLVERRRNVDRVKVIDFGMAKLGAGQGLTQAGVVVGTPHYMAPEQFRGEPVGPAFDLYAVGIMLFQVLTGRFPFDGSPPAIVAHHLRTPPPDPRAVAPEREIPAALAEACVRAMDKDPAKRFPDAEAFAEAIVRGATTRGWSRSDASLFPRPRSVPPPMEAKATVPEGHPVVRTDPPATPAAGAVASPASAEPSALIGRKSDLAWARAALADAGGPSGVILWGRAGTGRTRLLAELCYGAAAAGDLVVRVAAEPHPRSQVGFSSLRRIVRLLAGREGAESPVFGGAGPLSASFPGDVRAEAAIELSSALGRARSRAGHGKLLLALDDLDRMDGPTQSAVRDLLAAGDARDIKVLATSTEPPDQWLAEYVAARQVRGLSRADAERVLGGSAALHELGREEDIEPLYLDQLARLVRQGGRPLARLEGLVEQRVRGLPPSEQRVLQALGVTGGGTAPELANVLARPADLDESVVVLLDGGFVVLEDGELRAAHEVIGRIALAVTPLGAITELHDRAAEALSSRKDLVELRAYHAIRGPTDFSAFLLVEESVRLRQLRGDLEGAIAALRDAVTAARTQVLRGDLDGLAAWVLFGVKLASLLLDASTHDDRGARPSAREGEAGSGPRVSVPSVEPRSDVGSGPRDKSVGSGTRAARSRAEPDLERVAQAARVLREILQAARGDERACALIHAELARVAQLQQRWDDAESHGRAAGEAADRAGDPVLAERVRAACSAPPEPVQPSDERGASHTMPSPGIKAGGRRGPE